MSKKTKVITIALILITFICGILILCAGIGRNYKTNKTIKNYISTEGYLMGYIPNPDNRINSVKNRSNAPSYKLVYNYVVDGQEYSIATDYSTGILPKIGSSKEIKYNPSAPDKAVIMGTNGIIPIGIFFIVIPLIFLSALLLNSSKKVSIDMIGFMIGLSLIICSYGVLYIVTGQVSIKGIVDFYSSSFTVPLLIPIVLIVGGVCFLIYSLFFSKKDSSLIN